MTFNDFIEILIYAIALEVIIINVHSLIKDYKLRLGERAILNHYGITEQVSKLKEECRELIEAADGYINGTDSKAHFLEEIADVEVMLDQMKLHFNAQDKVDEIKRFKVKRQLGRIEREEQR
jgi:hypothetical protein